MLEQANIDVLLQQKHVLLCIFYSLQLISVANEVKQYDLAMS